MATTNSFADVMQDWEKVLAACTDNAGALAAAEPQRAAVEAFLKEARDLKGQQESHRAAKQQTRQQLGKVIKDGREAVRRLRGAVKANLGTDNERLVQFNIAPSEKLREFGMKPFPARKPARDHPAPYLVKPGAPRNPTAP
ncbi:MAG TPA: hypothetical protein VGH73_22270 [Thermoanaerobaculia bacterium]|jgi:hypothetical protein